MIDRYKCIKQKTIFIPNFAKLLKLVIINDCIIVTAHVVKKKTF